MRKRQIFLFCLLGGISVATLALLYWKMAPHVIPRLVLSAPLTPGQYLEALYVLGVDRTEDGIPMAQKYPNFFDKGIFEAAKQRDNDKIFFGIVISNAEGSRSPQVVKELMVIYETNSDPQIKSQALNSLAPFDTVEKREFLFYILNKSVSSKDSSGLIFILYAIDKNKKIVGPEIEEKLFFLIGKLSDDVDRVALSILSKSRNHESFKGLRDVYLNSKHNRTRRLSLISALNRESPCSYAVEILKIALGDEDAHIRWLAVQSLGMNGEREILESIIGSSDVHITEQQKSEAMYWIKKMRAEKQ